MTALKVRSQQLMVTFWIMSVSGIADAVEDEK